MIPDLCSKADLSREREEGKQCKHDAAHHGGEPVAIAPGHRHQEGKHSLERIRAGGKAAVEPPSPSASASR